MKANVLTGHVQILNRLSYISTASHLQRLGTPLTKESKSVEPRMLHHTEYGITCCVESPEGASCGIVVNLCCLAYISLGTDFESVREIVVGIHGVLEFSEALLQQHDRIQPLYIDGKIVGLITSDEVASVVGSLRAMKQNMDLPFDASIQNLKEGVHLWVEQGRMLRPLLVCSELSRLPNVLESWSDVVNLWDHLLESGIIEYVQKDEELQCCQVATRARDILDDPNAGYTHMELDPAASLFGIAALLQPYSDRNQAPRDIYNAAMMKQAITVPLLSYRRRADMHMYVLDYSSQSIVRTRAHDLNGHKQLPQGMTCILGVGSYGGFNQEDSVIAKRSSIERGFSRVTYFRVYKEDLSNGSDDRFEKPNEWTMNLRDSSDYSQLDDDGFISVGAIVRKNTVLIGKVSVVSEIGPNGKHRLVKRDQSIIQKENETGVVEQVIFTKNCYGRLAVKVKIRYEFMGSIGGAYESG